MIQTTSVDNSTCKKIENLLESFYFKSRKQSTVQYRLIVWSALKQLIVVWHRGACKGSTSVKISVTKTAGMRTCLLGEYMVVVRKFVGADAYRTV